MPITLWDTNSRLHSDRYHVAQHALAHAGREPARSGLVNTSSEQLLQIHRQATEVEQPAARGQLYQKGPLRRESTSVTRSATPRSD